MKNKKLFAILTLVCFMFTLMPVAAFAVNEDPNIATAGTLDPADATKMYFGSVETGYANLDDTTSPTHLKVTTAGAYYIYAVDANGELAELVKDDGYQVGKTVLVNATTSAAIKVKFAESGTYTLHAANYANTTQSAIIANENWAKSDADILNFLKGFSKLTMYNNTVTVGTPETDYVVTVSPAGATTIAADNGYSSTKVLVQVKKGGYAVPNAEVNVYTDSYGLTATPLTKVTNAAGQMYVLVTGSVPGTFAVYAEYEGDVCVAPQSITVNAVGAEEVSVVAEPVAPVNKNTTVGNSGIVFKITDGFGNDALVTSPQNYKVTLVSAPVAFMTNDTYTLTPSGLVVDGYVLEAANHNQMKYEGKYTFQVSLQNGASATASVDVKKFDETVAIKFVKPVTTMAYNTTGSVLSVYGIVAVDANGVTKNLTASTPWSNLTISANGRAIDNFVFNATTGVADLYPIADEDYIGSVVNVMAVYKDGTKTFTATNDITIVDNAATIVYKDATAEVGVNTILEAEIVDATGKVTPVTTTSTVQVIVLDKPENAVVNAKPVAAGGSLGANVDDFKVNFLASAAGEYKIQTIVITNDNKYISGIETIVVGAGEGTFKDVVVVSLGADSMIVNNEVVKLDVAPFIENNRTMMQFNVLYVFGIDVQWDGVDTITAEGNGVKAAMKLGSKVATVNGQEVTLDVAPYSLNGRTVVPVGFVTGTFGINPTFTYNADGSIADILFTK